MAIKKHFTTITDHMDGQPSIVLANGNWGTFDPAQEKYIDTGLKASPEDDATAVKYYKTTKTPEPPTAPKIQKGWDSRQALDSALFAAGWDEDPITVNETNRFCWMASYGKTSVTDEEKTSEQGIRIMKPLFTFTSVRLWSNFAPSPKITVTPDGKITITNPDGSTEEQAFVTPATVTDLVAKIEDMQKQVDGAVEAYSMRGVPTLENKPVTTWLLDDAGNPITDTKLKADIFKAHIGDSYTDLDTFNSYRFVLRDGGSENNHADYRWEVLAQSDYTKALADIARLGDEKVTIHLDAEPNNPYHKGDLWITQENGVVITKVAINDGTVYKPQDWVQPYATKKELDATNQELADTKRGLEQAKSDIENFSTNLTELGDEITNMNGEFVKAIEDSIITQEELKNIKDIQDRIDVEQRQARSNMTYLLESEYLPEENRTSLEAIKVKFLKKDTGSVDVLQAKISQIISDQKVTDEERSQYASAFATYKAHLIEFNEEAAKAQKAIDAELKRLADERVDNIKISHNLILESKSPRRQKGGFSIYYFSQQLQQGMYRISFNINVITPPIDGHFLLLFGYKSNQRIPLLLKYEEGKTHYTKTFKIANEPEGKIQLYIYPNASFENFTTNEAGEAIFSNVIVTAGETYHAYQEASEDIDNKIDEATPIIIDLSRQGSFKTYYKQVENGVVLDVPKKVSEVVGGVKIGTENVVQVVATIYRGNEDVTEIALSNGANHKWFVNGTAVQQGGSYADGGHILNMTAEQFADGKDDDVQFEIDITNAKDW